MKKKLAIIGGNKDQKRLVETAKEMGIETHCFSWDKSAKHTVCKGIADYFHPISVIEKEQILEKCKEININGVVSICNDVYVPTVAYVAEKMGLTGNSYQDTFITSDKYTLRQVFSKQNVKTPRFAIAKEGVDLKGFRYPLIVKPVDRCASIGVIKVEKEEDLQKSIQKSLEQSYIKKVIIEEFISGVEISVDSISWKGKHYILGIKDKEFTSGGDFVLLSEHYPAQLSFEIQEEIKTETLKALDSINFKYGASNTQFKITESGEIFSIEINPRMASDFAYTKIKLYNGYDYIKGVIDVALGKFEEPIFTENKFSGSYYLHEETEWVRQIIENKSFYSDIIESELFKENEVYFGIEGYFIYQSTQKKRFTN